MTKEKFERAKAIEEELLQMGVAVEQIQEAEVKGMDGVMVDLTPVWLRYKVESLQLFNERKAALEAEFETL